MRLHIPILKLEKNEVLTKEKKILTFLLIIMNYILITMKKPKLMKIMKKHQ